MKKEIDHVDCLSLCAGGGGLDRGFQMATPSARTVCYVEREAFAISYLVREMEAKRLDTAPCWTDVRTFDGKQWRGLVDCILAGYPCQPFSTAGKRRGHRDPRHLWPEIARIISEVSPSIVFL